jgi:hypothetical protein
MRLLYDKWRLPLDDSYQEREVRGARVFRLADKTVSVWHDSTGLSKQEGIRCVLARANPRHVTLFKHDWSFIYRWAFKHAEELETPQPNKYLIEAYFVIGGEVLSVVATHEQPEDQRWAIHFVNSVEHDRDWNVTGKGYIYDLGSKYLLGSNSRTDDGEWFANRFIRSIPADADPRQLGKLVRQVLERTRRDVSTLSRSRYAASSSRRSVFFRLAGTRSQWDLESWANLISLSAEEDVITLVPSFNYQGYAHIVGCQLLESQAVKVAAACSDEELGQALQIAKGRCSQAWG